MKFWIGACIFIATIIGFKIWRVCYDYKDCKHVGHTTLYCAMRTF